MFQKINNKKIQYQILSYILLLGLSLFLTGYFWQEKLTRIQTLFYFLVVAPILLSLFYQIKNYPFNRIFLFSFLFVLYTVSSILWSENISIQTFFHEFKKFILLLSLFFAINHVSKNFPAFEINILNIMILVASVLAIFNIYSLLTTVGLEGRIGGWGYLDNAIVTAEVFGLIFLFSFMQFLNTKNKSMMLFYLIVAALILLEILLNKSRSQQFAMIIALFLILFFTPRENLKRLIPVAILSLAGLFYLVFFTERLGDIYNRGFSLHCRDTIWKDVLPTALETPFFGRGEGSSDGYVTYCHNEILLGTHSTYLSIFLYQGLVGVFLALLATIEALRTAYKSQHEMDVFWGIIIIYGFITFSFNGDSLLSRPNEIWMLFWIPVAFISMRKKPLNLNNHF